MGGNKRGEDDRMVTSIHYRKFGGGQFTSAPTRLGGKVRKDAHKVRPQD